MQAFLTPAARLLAAACRRGGVAQNSFEVYARLAHSILSINERSESFLCLLYLRDPLPQIESVVSQVPALRSSDLDNYVGVGSQPAARSKPGTRGAAATARIED